MASTLAISSSDMLLRALYKAFPTSFPKATTVSAVTTSKLTLPTGDEVDGSNTIATYFTQNVFPDYTYSSIEKAEVTQWLTVSSQVAGEGILDADTQKNSLTTLNAHLSTRTTVLGSKPSVADIAIFSRLSSLVKSWSADQRTGKEGYRHIVRHFDFVQNAPLFALKPDQNSKVTIDLDDVKDPVVLAEAKPRPVKAAASDKAAAVEEKAGAATTDASSKIKEKLSEAKDKVKGVAAAVVHPTEKKKKEKQPKPQKVAEVVQISPSQIDLRVGHILKAVQHPNADSLYVSTIACGDPAGSDIATTHAADSEFAGQVTRTVCSGLNGLVPLEELQGRKVVVVCNLKPVTMRGIKSAAMVLAASPRPTGEDDDAHKGPVELVTPPTDAIAGEPVYFEGWEGKAEGVLNPKKKVWETVQPGFTTTDTLDVQFDSKLAPLVPAEGRTGSGLLKTKSGGLCTVKSLKGATVR